MLNHNIGEYIAKAHGTAGLAHITKGKFEESQINLPPFNEQKRIANKIEELFSFLDVGVESLRKVKAQLKCYRQAVLKYAFEGKLTEEWRKTHKDQIEPATKLLERIGQASKNKEQKSPVQSREKQSSIDLPELPESWVWTTIGDLIIDARYGTSKKCYSEPDGVPVLRIPNIVKERLDFTDLKYTHLSDEEVERISLKFGDILIVRTNGSLEFIGRATTVGEQQNNYTFASYLIRLRPVIADILPRYLVLFLSSEIGRKTIQRRARTTAGQFNINLDALRSIPIPLSSLTEQEKIIEDIDRHFSFVDETEKTMSICIEISEHLRQSILKVVFEGKLIPQDPTDEPAEKLLERIMGERVKQIKTETRNKNDLGQVEFVRFVK